MKLTFNVVAKQDFFILFIPELLEICLQLLNKEEVDFLLLNLSELSKSPYDDDVGDNGYAEFIFLHKILEQDYRKKRRSRKIIRELFILNPVNEICIEAIKVNCYVLEQIPDPTTEMYVIACEQDYGFIKLLEEPCEAIQLSAINNSWMAIYDIQNPTDKVKIIVRDMINDLYPRRKADEYLLQFGLEREF